MARSLVEVARFFCNIFCSDSLHEPPVVAFANALFVTHFGGSHDADFWYATLFCPDKKEYVLFSHFFIKNAFAGKHFTFGSMDDKDVSFVMAHRTACDLLSEVRPHYSDRRLGSQVINLGRVCSLITYLLFVGDSIYHLPTN